MLWFSIKVAYGVKSTKKIKISTVSVEKRWYVSHRYSDEGIKITVMSQICILFNWRVTWNHCFTLASSHRIRMLWKVCRFFRPDPFRTVTTPWPLFTLLSVYHLYLCVADDKYYTFYSFEKDTGKFFNDFCVRACNL